MGGAAAGVSVSVPFLDPADKKSEYDSLIKTDLAFRAEIAPDKAAFCRAYWK